LGSRAYYANQKIFKSNLLWKKADLKLYWTKIRPMITYSNETWVLKESIKRKLLITERNIFRRLYGPTKDWDGTCSIKTNDELHNLIIIILLITLRSKGWADLAMYTKWQMIGWS
jgi:hypothetical protein